MAYSTTDNAGRSRNAEYFKRVYAKADLKALTCRENTTLKNINIQEHAFGEGVHIPLTVDLPTGGSASRVRAVANARGSTSKKWVLDVKEFFEACNIPALDQALSKQNPGAYLELKKKEMDGKIQMLGNRFEQMLWNDGEGDLAQIIAGGVSTVDVDTYDLTLTGGSAISFHIGMTVLFNVARTGGTNKNMVFDVTRVNDATDVIRVVRNAGSAAVTPPVALDYIFVDGDHGLVNAAGTSNLIITGIPAYIPASDPGTGGVAATLNGLDRSARPSLLAGWRGTDEGTIVESAKSLIAKMGKYARFGPKSALMLSFNNWKQLEADLGDKAWRDQEAEAVFNTGAIMMMTPKGKIPCIAIPQLNDSACFLGDLDTVILRHIEKFPHLRMDGGQASQRLDWADNQDGERYEFRCWAECAVDDPSRWGRFPVTA